LGKKLLIRNLAASIDASTLEDMFMSVGNVESATILLDEITGLSQGLARVEMSTDQEAADCIERFHGQERSGRILVVVEDIPHVPDLAFRAKRKVLASAKKKKARPKAKVKVKA
jgi:RNA recognition motif-containing protein